MSTGNLDLVILSCVILPNHFISFFNQETGLASIYYPPCFPFQPRDPFVIVGLCYFSTHSSSSFNQDINLSSWSSFSSNCTSLGSVGPADGAYLHGDLGSRRRSTCGNMGNWASRTRPVAKQVIPRVGEMWCGAGCDLPRRQQGARGRRPSRASDGSERMAPVSFPPSPMAATSTLHLLPFPSDPDPVRSVATGEERECAHRCLV